MKTINITHFSIALLTALTLSASAQSGTGGFFNQQQSKFRIMLQQIVSLQQQYFTLKKGYNSAATGLNKAKELKNGTFSLHGDYYASLYQVSAAVRNNPKVKEITVLQEQVIGLFDAAIAWQKEKQLVSGDEINYFKSVYSKLLEDCKKSLEELRLAVSPGEMQMTDAQRLAKIDQLYRHTQAQYAFVSDFTGQAYTLANNRADGDADERTLMNLYQNQNL